MQNIGENNLSLPPLLRQRGIFAPFASSLQQNPTYGLSYTGEETRKKG